MDFDQIIQARRSVRDYESRQIPEETLDKILSAGLAAPSAVNLQPWYFVAIRSPENMHKLSKIMGRVSQKIEPDLRSRFAKHPAVVDETTRFLRKLGGAPVCILAFQLKSDYAKTESTIVQSISAAIENILLAAVNEGLGGCWLTAPLETGAGDELRDIFAPGKGGLVALLTLGYPAKIPNAPARKDGRYVII